MTVPADLKYSKEHEWVRREGTRAVVGITDHAQEELGDIVFVELPQPGAAVTRGVAFGVVESVKAVSDLYAPVSGTVQGVNEDLAGSPELVNQEPYGRGWMIVVEQAAPEDEAGLLTAEEYQAHIDQIKK